MAKDINIHLKTTGAGETKRKLSGVGKSAEHVGDSAEKMGSKTSRAANWIKKGIGSLVGPLGFAAIAIVVARVAVKVAKFFDNLKTQSDEAVRNVQKLRAGYESLFEALNAFDEKSREAITKSTNLLLEQAAATKEIGLPVINAYTRQFKELVETGELTPEQYSRGLEEMLGYAERHGGEATADLIAMMKGWGMTTPEKQGEFRRTIATGAQAAGLTDAEVIRALSRGMVTIRAMGWQPSEAVETISVLAAGEAGRKKLGLPATTLQALMAPQITGIEEALLAKIKLPEKITKEKEEAIKERVKERATELGQDPRQLLLELAARQQQMTEKAFTGMLVRIYGTEAAAGVSKLLRIPREEIRHKLAEAAGAEGAEAEREEEQQSRTTQRRRDARAKALAREEDLDITLPEQYEEDVREIGEAARDRLRRREPKRQWIRELLTTEEREKEEAAQRKWELSLTEKEKAAMEKAYDWSRFTSGSPYQQAWGRMTPQEQFEALSPGGERVPPSALKQRTDIDIKSLQERPSKAKKIELPPTSLEILLKAITVEPLVVEPLTIEPTAAEPTAAEPAEKIGPVSKTIKTRAESIAATIPVPAELSEEETPVEAIAMEVPAEMELPEAEVPAETELPEEETPAEAIAMEVPAEAKEGLTAAGTRQAVVNHYYDNSIKYYPKVGDDLVGPRYSQFG